jgi:hypothetical protein
LDVVEFADVQGCSSTVITRVLVSPVAASAMRLVGTPGMNAGANVTLPSIAEVAVVVWVARSGA